ncbi:hypothetical protein, partial [Escherichia coli]|uniref:hypothetical protein n=1 Tax=Escherichia coli TaxID=562 RepID=UPI00195469FF
GLLRRMGDPPSGRGPSLDAAGAAHRGRDEDLAAARAGVHAAYGLRESICELTGTGGAGALLTDRGAP